jgi:serine/threonine protein kinase
MAPRKDPTTFITAFSSYTVLREVGEGGSGRVYEVADSSGKVVAIKSLDPTKLTTDKVKRFKNETHFCLRSPHKNIVTVLEYGVRNVNGKHCPFYVMPLYPKTLRTLISEKIQPNKVLTYFAQILDGVEAAHLLGVWHRDLKPENILFDSASDSLAIADFGIARFVKEDLFTLVQTQPSTRLANFQYAAPEQRKRGVIIDQRADIYALGLLLNEMFTGEVVQGTAFRTIESVASDFAYLDDIVNGMIRQAVHERPSSVDQVKQAILARQHEYISRQKLSTLKNEVISQTDIDDPLVLDPIRLIGVDYDHGDLVFKLSREPNMGWENVFHQLKNVPFLTTGQGPDSIRFYGNSALFELLSRGQAQQLTNLFKTYLEAANRQYADFVKERQLREEEALRTKLRQRVDEEELRQEILSKVRL